MIDCREPLFWPFALLDDDLLSLPRPLLRMMAPAPPRSSPRALLRSRPASPAALLIVALLLGPDAAAAAVAVCTGKSASLPQSQCQACVDLYDDTGGTGWTGSGAGCQRNDPCAPCPHPGGGGIVCNQGGTTVTGMCVFSPRLARAPPCVRAGELGCH